MPFPCYSYVPYFLFASFSSNFTYLTTSLLSLPLYHHFSLPVLPTLNQSGQCDDLLAALPAHASLQDAGFSMTPLAFEKDDDSHMRVIAAVGNLRARWVFIQEDVLSSRISLHFILHHSSLIPFLLNVVDFFFPSSILSFLCTLLCPHQTSSLSINFLSSVYTHVTPSLPPSFCSYLFSLSPHFLSSNNRVEITRYLKLIYTLLVALRARSHPPLLPPLLSSQVSKGNNHL